MRLVLRRRPSAAMVVAAIALVVAASGTADFVDYNMPTTGTVTAICAPAAATANS